MEIEDDFDIPMDGIDAGSVGGFEKVMEGMYLAEIVGVDPDGGHNGAAVIDFEILRGTVSNQEGMIHRETFFKDLSKESCRKKFAALNIATELQTAEEIKRTGKCPFRKSHYMSRLVVIELSEFNGFMNISYSDHIWHPADRRANRCPLHAAKIAAAKIALPANRHIDGAVAVNGPKPAKSSATERLAPEKQAKSIDDLKF